MMSRDFRLILIFFINFFMVFYKKLSHLKFLSTVKVHLTVTVGMKELRGSCETLHFKFLPPGIVHSC